MKEWVDTYSRMLRVSTSRVFAVLIVVVGTVCSQNSHLVDRMAELKFLASLSNCVDWICS